MEKHTGFPNSDECRSYKNICVFNEKPNNKKHTKNSGIQRSMALTHDFSPSGLWEYHSLQQKGSPSYCNGSKSIHFRKIKTQVTSSHKASLMFQLDLSSDFSEHGMRTPCVVITSCLPYCLYSHIFLIVSTRDLVSP